jgi:hypothetical protein
MLGLIQDLFPIQKSTKEHSEDSHHTLPVFFSDAFTPWILLKIATDYALSSKPSPFRRHKCHEHETLTHSPFKLEF